MRQFVLLTAAHNERMYLPKTISSVVSQSRLPLRWIIASDRSTDSTEDLVAEAAAKFPFLGLVAITGAQSRNFGAKVRALQVAERHLAVNDYSFLGVLDGDVGIPQDYFERLLARMEADPNLGIAGGQIHEKRRGQFEARPFNSARSVAGAVQFFRRECFEQIGGYRPLPFGGVDTYVEFKARMAGWEIRSYPDLVVEHYRPTSSAGGSLIKLAWKQGLRDASLGYDPIYELLACVRRASNRPILSCARLTGYLKGALTSEAVDPELKRFLRDYQKRRIWGTSERNH